MHGHVNKPLKPEPAAEGEEPAAEGEAVCVIVYYPNEPQLSITTMPGSNVMETLNEELKEYMDPEDHVDHKLVVLFMGEEINLTAKWGDLGEGALKLHVKKVNIREGICLAYNLARRLCRMEENSSKRIKLENQLSKLLNPGNNIEDAITTFKAMYAKLPWKRVSTPEQITQGIPFTEMELNARKRNEVSVQRDSHNAHCYSICDVDGEYSRTEFVARPGHAEKMKLPVPLDGTYDMFKTCISCRSLMTEEVLD